MIIEAILYTGEPKLINNLYQRFADRLDRNLGVNVEGGKDRETVIGHLITVKMNPEQTQLIGKIKLLLDKYIDYPITKVTSNLPEYRATWEVKNEI